MTSPTANALESYLGLNYGKSVFTQFFYEDQTSALSLYGGVRINRNIGFELFHADFGEIKRDFFSESTFDLNATGISLLGIFPMTNRFEIFPKGAILAWNKDYISGYIPDDGSGVGYLVGFGINFDFNPTISLGAGYDMYYMDEMIDVLHVGLKVNF